MTKTTLQNNTGSIIVLNEGQAGMLRKLCDIPPGGSYIARSQLNQTYKEYWCVSNNSNQFTLSSDDLSECKEIVIKPTDADPNKFHWEGIRRGQKTAKVKDSSTTAPSGTRPAHSSSSVLSKLGNKVAGWFH